MIDDTDPNWGRSYRVSSADLGDLRRKWADTGRAVWNAATRAGRDLKARTEQELEALGRAHLEQAGVRQQQGQATARRAGEALQAGREAVAGGVSAIQDHIQDRGSTEIDRLQSLRRDGLALLGTPQALPALERNREAMVDANYIGADKYFHCKGNCEAAQRGPAADEAAHRLGNGREVYGQWIKHDPASDEYADQAANRFGRAQGRANPGGSCRAGCSIYRPQGLPPTY